MPATAKTANRLLAAIHADPTDDTPRLAYAEHLEHDGDADRAEFIRAQCALAKLPVWDRRTKTLHMRERALLIRHGEEWRSKLPKIQGVAWGKFERGFISEIIVEDVTALAKRIGTIQEVIPISGVQLASVEGIVSRGGKDYPWLRTLRLGATCAAPDAIQRVVNSSLIKHLAKLVCGPGVATNEGANAIAAAAHLTELREIDFTDGTVGDPGVNSLSRAAHLASLRTLRLGRTTSSGGATTELFITPVGIRYIAFSQHLSKLTTLDVRHQRLNDDAARAIFTGTATTRLETLVVTGAALTARAFEVAGAPSRLRDVDFGQCVIGDVGATALAKMPQLADVHRLSLRSCEVGAKGLAALARSPIAKTVQELDLADNPIRTAGMNEFLHGKWPELHTLSLASSGISAESMKSLQAAEGFGPLVELDLSHNEIGAAGAIAAARAKWASGLIRLNLALCKCAAGAVLAGSPKLRKLQYLDLTGNPLTGPGIEALMEGEWPDLTDLRLGNTAAGNEGARSIATSGLLARLLTLTLQRCGITDEGLKALLEKPAPSLVELNLAESHGITEDGIKLLAETTALPALRFLSIAHLGLGPDDLLPLIGSRFFSHLLRLDCDAESILPEVQQWLWTHFDFRSLNAAPPPDWSAAGFTIPTGGPPPPEEA